MPERSITDIGKYKILGLVGEGAMGVVYRATDSSLNRTVAIKVMSDAIARQQDLRDRFLREAQAAGSMQHPNVVSIYDLGEMEGHLYIAMEFVEGVDLETIISRRRDETPRLKNDPYPETQQGDDRDPICGEEGSLVLSAADGS